MNMGVFLLNPTLFQTDAGLPIKVFKDAHTVTVGDIGIGSYNITWVSGKTPIAFTGAFGDIGGVIYEDIYASIPMLFYYNKTTGDLNITFIGAPNAGDVVIAVVIYAD
jgi:hypothetical protein